MGLLDLVEKKMQDRQSAEERLRNYNDIAVILWYHVLYDDVLSYKKAKMDSQNEPFRIYSWGNNHLIYGPVKALTSREEKEKFERVATAELRDRGYNNLKVKAYSDAVIVER